MNDDWLDLLPIESLESLLEGLATRWRELLDARRAYVSCLSADARHLVVGWAPHDGSGSPFEYELPPGDHEWSAEWAAPKVRSAFWGEVDFEADLQSVPFGDAAGLLVHGPTIDFQQFEQPMRASRALLQEARQLDKFQRDALAEKLESMAEFAAGAGHEINNPLATINGRVQLLLKGETDPERRRSLEVIGGQAHRVRDMIGDAMLFARPPEPQLADVDAVEVVRRVCDTFREDAPEGVAWTIDVVTWPVDAPQELILRADESQLAIVVGELLRNSLHAVGDSGEIRVNVSRLDANAKSFPTEHAIVEVTDDGPGLTDLDRLHLFDPFYSGRQAGRGLGFGLSKAWRIVRLHGGTIDVESEPGGTSFTVRWPLAQ